MGVSAEAASIIPRDNPTKLQKSQAITPRSEKQKTAEKFPLPLTLSPAANVLIRKKPWGESTLLEKCAVFWD